MKHRMRYLYLLSLLLLYTTGAWGGGTITVITQVEGTVSAEGGQVTTEVTDGTCLLTVAPISGYQITADDIKVTKVISADFAQARGNAPALVETIPLTTVQASDPTRPSRYSFVMPATDYDVEITANFRRSAIKYYPLWVKDIQVNDFNKANILADGNGTVRYNPSTNTLTLYAAKIDMTDETPVVRSALPDGLTVDLRGITTMTFKYGFVSEVADAPLVFTPNMVNPGQLSWELAVGGAFSQGFVISYQYPLELQSSGNLISVTPVTNYPLKIGDKQVTSVNCMDVLGDGTVRFDTFKTLILNGATLTAPITSGLDQLNIYLQGASTLSCNGDLLTSTVADAKLSFETAPNTPGKLVLTKTTGDWFKGFKTEVDYLTNLTTTEEGNVKTILDKAAISPINSEENPTNNVSIEDPTPAETEEYINITINDVLYTLPVSAFTYESATADEPGGVVLNSEGAPDDSFSEMDPGSPEFAEAFTGLTFRLSAGTGNVEVEATINADSHLAVKIGSNTPVLLPNDDDPTVEEMHKYFVPYSVSVPTYVYVYLQQAGASEARSDGPHRGKVLHGHVKVTSVGASSESIVSENSYSEQTNTIVDNKVKLYSLPESAITGDGNGVVLSTIEIEDNGTAESRDLHRAAATQQKKITELAPTVFDQLDKSQILYVDLSGTDVADFTVNRISGIMSGFANNTLIYLPQGNDDGGEENVVVNDSCRSLSLYDDWSFRAHRDFVAANAVLNSDFVAGQASTLMLPFTLSQASAEALGHFFTLKEIAGEDVILQPQDEGDIMANTPYVFLAKVDGKVTASDVKVVPLETFTVAQGQLVGTYQPLAWSVDQTDVYTPVPFADDYAVGQFVRAEAGSSLGSFHAYLKASGLSSPLYTYVDGHVSGIESMYNECTMNNVRCYDLQGRNLHRSQLKKGLYILNGKKLIVK